MTDRSASTWASCECSAVSPSSVAGSLQQRVPRWTDRPTSSRQASFVDAGAGDAALAPDRAGELGSPVRQERPRRTPAAPAGRAGRSCAAPGSRARARSAPAALHALGRGAAELDRDHRVERAVRDRDRIAVEARQVELEPFHLRHEPGQRHDRCRPRPARAEPERPAHHRALREAAEDDAVDRHRERVEERCGSREAWGRR